MGRFQLDAHPFCSCFAFVSHHEAQLFYQALLGSPQRQDRGEHLIGQCLCSLAMRGGVEVQDEEWNLLLGMCVVVGGK